MGMGWTIKNVLCILAGAEQVWARNHMAERITLPDKIDSGKTENHSS